MTTINIPEEQEAAIDLMLAAKEELDKLEPSRTVSLAKTSLQQSLLWLLSPAIADALEEQGEEITGDDDAPTA